MMIGIIGAMAIEVEEILAKLEHPQTETISGMDFVRGAIQGVECVVAVSYTHLQPSPMWLPRIR